MGTRATGIVGRIVGVVVLVVAIGACGSDNSASSRLDRLDSVDGIKVTVTSCDARPLPPTADGIPQTEYSAKGTLESDPGEGRTFVKVHVRFLDGNKEFGATNTDESYTLGFGKEYFSAQVTLSEKASNLQCKGTATK